MKPHRRLPAAAARAAATGTTAAARAATTGTAAAAAGAAARLVAIAAAAELLGDGAIGNRTLMSGWRGYKQRLLNRPSGRKAVLPGIAIIGLRACQHAECCH